MIISTISHEEAMIRHFMEDPEFAKFYLSEVIADGDLNEIRRVKRRIDEARSRLRERETELEAALA